MINETQFCQKMMGLVLDYWNAETIDDKLKARAELLALEDQLQRERIEQREKKLIAEVDRVNSIPRYVEGS